MKILNKVTLAALKKNKTRTLVTIIGIILSTALLCAVLTSAASFVNYMKEETIAVSGNWHARIQSADYRELTTVKECESIEASLALQKLGYASFSAAFDNDRPYLYVLGDSDFTADFIPIKLVKGRYPTGNDELILPDSLARYRGFTWQIGDQITLALGDRVAEQLKLGQDEPYRQANGENLAVREERTYRLVGFYESLPGVFEKYNTPGYSCFTFADSKSDAYAYDLYLRFNKPRAYSAVIEDKAFPLAKEKLEMNRDLMVYYGQAPFASFANYYKLLYRLVALITLLIVSASISMIYNAFSISVSERIKQFGILSSIGATRKQLRHSVLFEAFILCLFAIPLGIILGITGIGTTFLLIGDKFKTMGLHGAPELYLSPLHLGVTALIALLTVLISAYIPAKKALKITTMEAIRQNREIKTNHTAPQGGKLVYRLFGVSGLLASRYFKRSKKKYRATVISLFMSIVLFVSSFAFCAYLTESVKGGLAGIDYDLSVCFDPDTPSLANKETEKTLFTEFKQLEPIKAAAFTRHLYVDLAFNRSDIAEGLPYLTTDKSDPVHLEAELTFVDDEAFKSLLKENKLSESTYYAAEPTAVAIDQKAAYNSETGRYEVLKYLKHDTVLVQSKRAKEIAGYTLVKIIDDEKGSYYQYRNNQAKEEFKYLLPAEAEDTVSYRIGAVTANSPYYSPRSLLTLIYPLSRIDEVLNQNDYKATFADFYFLSADHHSAYLGLKNTLQAHNILEAYIADQAAVDENGRNIVKIIKVFAYGFIILISLVAAANVFNTISTNISLRRREFAMLQSIGMAEADFKRMLNFECLLYGSKALLYGLPAAGLVTYLIWHTIGIAYRNAFSLPWSAYMIAIGSVFAVVFATMIYAMQKLKQENLLNTLKNENV